MVVLAQLAEHRIVVPSVVGSSPTFHPKNKSAAFMVADFVFVGVCLGEEPILSGSPRILILGESVTQGENVIQGLCPQSREP